MYNEDNYENYETEDTENEGSSGSTLKDIYYNNKTLIWILGIIVIILILVALFNRGSSGNNAYVKPVNENEKVQLSRSKDLKIKVGNNEYNGSSDRLNWKSRNTSIAEIDNNGRVTGKSIGTTVIDVTYTESGKPYVTTININVFNGNENVPLQSANFDDKSLMMNVNSRYSLGDKVSVTPDSGYIYNIQYEISNPNIAMVDEGGVVTAKGEGKATITAHINDGAYKTQIDVYVNNAYKESELVKLPQKIDFQNGQTIKIPVNNGSVTELKLDLSPSDASSKYISWKSSDENTIAVSGEGNVAALREGSATITATAINGVTGKILVEGTNELVEIDSISVTPSNISLTVGSSSSIVPIVSPDSASNKALIFDSSDNSVVSVIPNSTKTSATVYGVKKGTAVVTIKSDNGKSATVTVTVTGQGGTTTPSLNPSSGGSIKVRLGSGADIVPMKKCNGPVDYYSAPLKVTIENNSGNANYVSYCYTKGCTPSDSKREKLPVTFEIKNSGTYILRVKKYTGESGNNEIKSSGSGNYDNGSLVYYINTKSSGLSCTSSSTWESGGAISTATEAKNACYCRNDKGDYSCTWAKQGNASFPTINNDFNTEAKCNLHIKQTCCHLENGNYVNGLTVKSNCVSDSRCGTSSGSGNLTAITVSESDIELKVGETKTISVRLTPSSVSQAVNIEVGDKSVATISESSINTSTQLTITAKKEGETTITFKGSNTMIKVIVTDSGAKQPTIPTYREDPVISCKNWGISIVNKNEEEVSCKANINGKFEFTISNTSVIKWDFYPNQKTIADDDVPANSYSSFDFNKVGNGDTSITVKFTPKDTNLYNSITRTISVNGESATVSQASPTNTTYTCNISRRNVKVCSYSRYNTIADIKNSLQNKSENSGYGCISKAKTYCGSTATACYDVYYCTK